MTVNVARVEQLTRDLLVALGQDPAAPGLRDTPTRVARAWAEFLDYDPGRCDTTFQVAAADQVVAVTGLRVWSVCEHHLMPFWCDVAAAYIAGDQVIGLSKVARLAHKHAHRLQVQERLANGLADDLAAVTGAPDVAVLATGQHLCMVARGVKTPGTMTTSVLRGRFRDDPATRAEFLRLVQHAQAVA